MDRPRLARLAICAAAAIAVFAATFALLLALRWQPALVLWNWAVGLVLAKWRGGWLPFVTVLAIIMELFFLNWEKTTLFRVFVRRGASAITDLGFALLTFSSFKWIADYVLSFGLALAAVKLGDVFATRLGWMRWEMPSDGLLQVSGAFAVYWLMSTFVGYWQHRLQHWGWFWQLHRFHHSGTDYNILTAFRVNPAEMMSNLIPVLSPLIFLKVPNVGLFAGFLLANQAIGSFQHSELPWNFGWFGRWVIVSPRNHQFITRSTKSTGTRISAIVRSGTTYSAPGTADPIFPPPTASRIPRMWSGRGPSGCSTSGFSIVMPRSRWPGSRGPSGHGSGGGRRFRDPSIRLCPSPRSDANGPVPARFDGLWVLVAELALGYSAGRKSFEEPKR